ncbi:hypothetical protein QA644_06660 [Rhizobium sp. CC1099]|uniref:hypothetical protein n=1 Tax=Rhizobium sp. CC1099 TaxID=3039160 RepID=UPI0024B07402|nr:hypothetical protein [Rhizobium sp. CC1099]WFU88740.1 hypothetical protein QA644_06660 [Rhizobium sp. CC1099]
MTPTAVLFGERSAFWTSKGIVGRALYIALAADSELPDNLLQEDVAAILNIDPASVKQRRVRGEEPSFLKLSGKIVLYPRSLFCMWLADMLVDRRGLEANPPSGRYTQASNRLPAAKVPTVAEIDT